MIYIKYVENGKMCSLPEPAVNTAEEKLQRLLDLREVEEILLHYTRCVDIGDFEGIGSCYCEDGCFYPSDRSKPISGRAAILKVFGKLMDPNVRTSAHYISNQQVHFVSNTEATVFAYFYANKSFSNGREDEVTYGGYELRVVKEDDGQWRMKTHKVFFTRQDGSTTGRSAEHKNRPWPVEPEKTF